MPANNRLAALLRSGLQGASIGIAPLVVALLIGIVVGICVRAMLGGLIAPLHSRPPFLLLESAT